MADLNSNPCPALVFDLGKVLIDWSPHYLYKRFFPNDPQGIERFLEETHFYEWNLVQDAGKPFAEAIPEMCAQYPQYAELLRAYDTCYEETVGGSIQGTVEILRELKQAGYPLYALSNWPSEKYYQIRPRFEFLDWFDVVLVSGDVKLVKPDPRIYQLLLDKIGRSAPECIFIDDSEHNIAGARAVGYQVILFRSPEQLRSELARLGIQLK